MIEVLKDTTTIGSKTLHVYVYVELNKYDATEYEIGYGATANVTEIAKRALSESARFSNTYMYGIFGKFIAESIDVYPDDSYEYDTIVDMLTRTHSKLNSDSMKLWSTKFTMLEELNQTVKYSGKTFNTYIEIFINK